MQKGRYEHECKEAESGVSDEQEETVGELAAVPEAEPVRTEALPGDPGARHSPQDAEGVLSMPAGSVAVKERHQPRVLVETAGLSEEEWLAYRRKGIGGSDVAALLGISPWRTARDLFYDKLNIAVVEDHKDNWVALEMGHLLEPLVAKIFQHQTGYKVYQIKKMFQHPKYPWMLADVDYFVELPDGTTAILEIKTTNYNAKDNWWLDGEETIPA